MDKTTKRKIRKLWGFRLTISLGLILIGKFAFYQQQKAAIWHREISSFSLEEKHIQLVEDFPQILEINTKQIYLEPIKQTRLIARKITYIEDLSWSMDKISDRISILGDRIQELGSSSLSGQREIGDLQEKRSKALIRLNELRDHKRTANEIARHLTQTLIQESTMLKLQVSLGSLSNSQTQDYAVFLAREMELLLDHIEVNLFQNLHKLHKARILLWSSVISSLALLISLIQLRGSWSLVLQFSAILPEDAAAELAILHERFKKAELPLWKHRLCLSTEASMLLIALIQIHFENTFLLPNNSRIDD
ncbi:MAG: hypothetical protein AAGD09_24125 [Cyanobacteria bacterium P01_F01_bin.56]